MRALFEVRLIDLATIALVIVGYWGVLEAKSALESTQRAWMYPVGAQLNRPLEKNKPIHLNLLMANSGREPAVDVNFKIQNDAIDSYNLDLADLRDVKVPENNTCHGLETIKGHTVFPPGAGTLALDSQHGEPQFVADEKVVDGNKFYVVQGCLAYSTYQKPHTSSFCYIMERFAAGIAPPNVAMASQQGIGVTGAVPAPATNQTSQPLVAYNFRFATCSSGFSAN